MSNTPTAAAPGPKPTGEEVERLRLFQKRVNDLRNCGVVRQGEVTLKVTFPLGGRADTEKVPFEGFDKEQFAAAMQTFRQFLLNDDAVCFNLICNIIWKKCDRQDVKDWSAYARMIWKQTLEAAPLSFTAGNKVYNVKEAIDVMLYGFLAHTKVEVAKEWEGLSPGGQATVYFIVQRSLFELFYCLNLVDSVILYWLDQPNVAIPNLSSAKAASAKPSGGK